MALTTEELAIIDASKNNNQTTLNLMNQVFTYTSNYKDINANSDSDVSISYIDSNGIEQSYTVPTFYKMNTTFQNLMSSMSDGNSYYTKTEVDTKDSAIETIAKRSGFKNYIINGGFDVWQRGTNFSASGYTADRWSIYIGSNTMTTSLQTDISSSIQRFCRLNVTSYVNTFDFMQHIEDVIKLAGKTVTISFYARASSNVTTYPYISQQLGVGGSGYVDTDVGITNPITIGTSWSKYSLIVTLPSLTSETLGTGSYTTFHIIRILSSFTGYIDISQIQIEEGSIATQFEQRPYGLELSLCQRYYERSDDPLGKALYAYGATVLMGLVFRVRKRIVPTLTISSRLNTIGVVSSEFTGLDVGVSTIGSAVSVDGVHNFIDSSSPFTVGQLYELNYIADAEI